MKPNLLSKEELQLFRVKLANWQFSDKKISRTWKFTDFIDAFGFMTKVAMLAEAMNHHPEWSNIYSTVKIELTTHDIDGLSNLDIELAKHIDQLG